MSWLRRLISLLVVVGMLAIGVLFALQNHVPVPLDLLVHEFAPRSLALWLLTALALGAVLGLLASGLMILRLRARLAAVTRQLEKSRLELDRLRVAGIRHGD